MKRFNVSLNMPFIYYDISANTPEEAIDEAKRMASQEVMDWGEDEITFADETAEIATENSTFGLNRIAG